MAFGQPSGPPATEKQVQQLLSLLQAAGHSDFRDARGPMGFTQRQAAGNFTRDEVAAFIKQLEAEAEQATDNRQPDDAPAATSKPASRPAPRAAPRASATGGALSNAEQALRKVPSSMLAAELQRRGWVVMEP